MSEKVEISLTEDVKAQFAALGTSVNESSAKVKAELTSKIEEQNKVIEKMEEKMNMLSVSTPGYEKDPARGFRNHTEFCEAVINAAKVNYRIDKMDTRLTSLFNTVGSDEARIASNPDGGFLIPPAYLSELLKIDSLALQNDTGVLTRKVPMAASSVSINARVDKNHATSVSGGFRVYRREETASVTESKAEFEQITLKPKSIMGISYATEEILADSPISFASLIMDGFVTEKTAKLNYERIHGSGVGEYLGILNSPALVTVSKVGSQTADTIVGANLIAMRQRIYGYNNAVWLCNQDTYSQLAGAFIAGTHTDFFLFNPERGTDVPATILGRPVMFDENMPTLGDKGDIMLVNFGEYLEGILGGATFMESIHVRFVNNERAFRFTMRCDGAPWWRSVLTPKKSAVTLSPFVCLEART